MQRWTIRRTSLFLLASVIFVMLLIVVLPYVDLLDTAFHRGTAPVVVHAQATSAPPTLCSISTFQPLYVNLGLGRLQERPAFAVSGTPNFLPILLHTLRR